MEENGRIVLHKSLFNQKKEPYAKLADIRQKDASSGGGASPISHADNAAPAISLESRGDAISSEPQRTDAPMTTSPESLQGNVSEGASLPISSEWHLAEHQDGVPDLLPTQGSNASVKEGKLQNRIDGGAQTEHHPADVSVTTSPESSQGKEGNTLQTAAQKPHGGVSSEGKITESRPTVQGKGAKTSVNEEGKALSEQKDVAGKGKSYTIEPTTYTNKKGKTTAMHLVKFDHELTKEQKSAGKELAKESRGWWDAKQGGFMMRSEEAANELAEALGSDEAVQDAQPISVKDMEAVNDKGAEKRKEVLSTIDQAVSMVTGKPTKEVRAERKEREAEYKAETKELYDAVLSGDFNDVTLQRINDYLDHVTPNNEYGRPLSKRLPPEVGRSVRKGERTSEVDVLFSRICESTVPAHERTRPEAKRRIEERKKELLKGWAIATGNWHTSVADFTHNTEPIGRGKDSVVYQANDGKSVIKVSAGKDNLKKFRPDIDAVTLFNHLFRNSSYEILGYGEVDGKFVKFLKQPFVDFTGSTPLSVKERVDYMDRMGFKPINDDKTAFSNGTLVVADLQGNNIVKDKSGNVRVIDADVKLHTKDFGGKYVYPAVETDFPEEVKTKTKAKQEPKPANRIELSEEEHAQEQPKTEQTQADAKESAKEDVSIEALEKEYEKLADKGIELEAMWEDKIGDYIDAHYPHVDGVRTRTAEQQALYDAERKAMKEDAVLKKMQEDEKSELDAHEVELSRLYHTLSERKKSAANDNKTTQQKPRLQKAEANGEGRTLLDVDGKPVIVKHDDGKIEMNYRTWKDGDKEKMRDILVNDAGLDPDEVDDMIVQADAVADGMQDFMQKYPRFGLFQNSEASKRPFIRDTGEYISIDYSFNCVKKEALNGVMDALVEIGKGGHLGVTQVEALKKILQKHGFLTPCVMCYVEAKRKVLKQSKRDEQIWNAVREAAGLEDKLMGEPTELTAKQSTILKELAAGKGLERVSNYTTKTGEGIKADSIKKVATLMLGNDLLRGNMNYEWFMSPSAFTSFYDKFGNTGIVEYLSQGQYRGKQLLDTTPFNIDGIPRDIYLKLYSTVELRERSGVRQFSYEDARATMFFDYYTQFLLLQGARAPMQLYTKRPFMPEMFGRTGAKMNQSLIVDVWRGSDWHRETLGMNKDEYDQWLHDHAGFIPKGALPESDARHEKGSAELVPAWSVESFPVDIAIKNTRNRDFRGHVGNVVVAPSVEFIKWALDNPDIHQILAYHAAGSSPIMKALTGYDMATPMDNGYHTLGTDGKMVSDLHVNDIGLHITDGVLQFSSLVRKNGGDARRAAQAYLDYCYEHGLTPMFNYEGVVGHKNYYKLLTDFRMYDEDGKAVSQPAVKAKLPDNWREILDRYLQEEQSISNRVSDISLDESIMKEINAATKYTSIEAEERETLTKLLGNIYGKDKVSVLSAEEFDKQLDADTEQGRAQMLRDAGGMVYGYAVGDRIVLNDGVFNANTPMHEHTHIWMKVVEAYNPKLYVRGMELWKDTPMWEEVRRDLESLGEEATDRKIFSECISRFTGSENEEIISKVTGVTDKKWLEKAMTWLREMWDGIKSAFSKWTGKDLDNLTAEEFGRMPIRSVYDEAERKKYTQMVQALRDVDGFEMDAEMMHDQQKRKDVENMKKKVADMFTKAQTGEFVGKPASIGRLSADGKAYLEKLSGLKFKEFVDFVLNPSDLNHIRSDHYGENEKDKGNNVPLTDEDIQNMVDVLNQPDGILYGVEKKDGRKLFFFLKDAGNGLYNLTEVCSTKKGNLTAKSFFKSKKKGISQRVMEIKDSLLPTSVTYSGEFLSSDAKIPTMFDINERSSENVEDTSMYHDGDSASYRIVDDPVLLNELENGEWEEAYRVMQVIDGELYPPMAAVREGDLVDPIKLGLVEQAEEHPELITFDENGKPQFLLNKGQGKGSIKAAYNPYWHTSRTALNDQFTSAYVRPNLVVVRTLVPKSELTSGYKAQYAKDAVGEMSWHSGSVSGQLAELGNPRKVILSRYDKPMEIIPNAEVARMIADQLEGKDIAIPYNVVWPQLRDELEKRGVEISEEASGTVSDEAEYGKAEYVTDRMIAEMNEKARRGMANSPEAKRTEANRLSTALHTPMTIVEDTNAIKHDNPTIQERRRRSKGWYDTKTGEVVVVLPNNRNVEDVAATVFHETVGHKGLRELIGDKGYSDFLREVYDHVKADVRRRIAKLAAKHNWDFEKATDEYLSRLAEKGFEDFDREERTVWQWLKEKVTKAIDKFLKSLKLPKWVKLGDNELRYMLWRSKERLERGKEHPIDVARDIVKREELGLSERKFNDKSRNNELKPIGRSLFGSVYNQFKGKVLQAVKFLANHESGDLLGVFHRKDIGDIDMVWGDEGGGLCHILDKHINDKDFPTVKDLLSRIEDIINNGEVDTKHSNTDKLVLVKDGYLVTIRRNVRKNGVKIADKNWILTAYNKDAPATTKAPADGTHGSTAVAPGTSSDAKLATMSEINKLSNDNVTDEDSAVYRSDNETEDIWKDHSMGLQERITAAATRLANNHKDNKTLRNDAMRAIGGNLTDLRKAMSLQRQFDITTVKRVADLARVLMDGGYLNDLSQTEVKRLLAAVKNSTGRNDIEGNVQKVMDIMVNNQLKNAEATLHRLESIKGTKVDARGVEVQGDLDAAGAHTMKVFKKARAWERTAIEEAMADVQQRMGSADTTVAEEAALDYAGLQIALDYVENITGSKTEEATLRQEMKQAHEDADEKERRTDSYRQYIDMMNEAIRQNKIDRAQAYYDLVGRISGNLRESMANAQAFKEAEKERIRNIQHNANSDMEGRPCDEHYKAKAMDKFVNNSFVQLVFAPLGTFEQMMRLFGSKSANGEGYLYNRFMRGWVDARQKEIRGVRSKYATLDAKAHVN